MAGNSKSFVHLVVQRYRSARLLLEETRWVSVPSANDKDEDEIPSTTDPHQQRQHCGLLLYVSFAAGANKSSVYNAAESCLNLPVLTTGLWGDGVSDQPSLRELLAHPEQYSETSTSIVIVPQANLISKVSEMLFYPSTSSLFELSYLSSSLTSDNNRRCFLNLVATTIIYR